MDTPAILKKKVAGLSVGWWAVGIAVAVGLALWWRQRQAATQDAGYTGTAEFNAGDPNFGPGTQGADWPPAEISPDDATFSILDALQAGFDSLTETIGGLQESEDQQNTDIATALDVAAGMNAGMNETGRPSPLAPSSIFQPPIYRPPNVPTISVTPVGAKQPHKGKKHKGKKHKGDGKKKVYTGGGYADARVNSSRVSLSNIIYPTRETTYARRYPQQGTKIVTYPTSNVRTPGAGWGNFTGRKAAR